MFETFEALLAPEVLKLLFKSAATSLFIAICALTIGTIIGVLIAFAKISKNKLLKIIATIYVEVIRGTPMLLQLMFFYLALPAIASNVFGMRVRPDVIIVGIIAISLNSGAYTSELFRGAIQSIDKGQWEASTTLGLSRKQMMIYVILPQAFKRVAPSWINEFIVLIKDSSLIQTIGGAELLYWAHTQGSNTFDFATPLLMAGFCYLIMTLVVSFFAKKLERKLAESD